MSIMANDMPMSSSVLVRPCENNRPPHSSTNAAEITTPRVFTPILSLFLLITRAMISTTDSFSSSAGWMAMPIRVVLRRAPLMMSPLKST